MEIAPDRLGELFTALEAQLRDLGDHVEPVVIGGSALLAAGLVSRATKDVDVVALAEGGSLKSARPLPESLQEARDRVARDFGLQADWLNPGPTDLLQFGLPAGFWERVVSRQYGPALTVHFAGRLDQIHFKLYAMVDQGGGRHEADLRAFSPSPEELTEAASWTQTHDPSPGFRMMLEQALSQFGIDHVDDPT